MKACVAKHRQGGYDDPATPEAWEAWDKYTEALSYPSPPKPVPDPQMLKNEVIDFELEWLRQRHPELAQYVTCRKVRPTLMKDVLGTLFVALIVVWFSVAMSDSESVVPIVIAVYLPIAALWCWSQHMVYRSELRHFCQRYEDK